MLNVSEMFYSLQGEGPSLGKNSIFLRLKGCNLSCGGKNTVTTGALDSGATWRCDTIETWITGRKTSFNDIFEEWEKKNWHHAQKLIITGGEPLLHGKELSQFIPIVTRRYPSLDIEFETNGTIVPPLSFGDYNIHYNVSPKLKNSGMCIQKRMVKTALNYFVKNPHSCFKFVLLSVTDYEEIKEMFIDPFNIPSQRVWLMPAADSRESLQKISKPLAELALLHHHNFSFRLHLYIWDKKTGV